MAPKLQATASVPRATVRVTSKATAHPQQVLARHHPHGRFQGHQCRHPPHVIPRISLSPTDSPLPFKLRRRQFPIRLAFAITINKSKAQTHSRVGLYLPRPCFSHGQLYVAFSRCGFPPNDSNGVRCLIPATLCTVRCSMRSSVPGPTGPGGVMTMVEVQWQRGQLMNYTRKSQHFANQ